MKQLPGNAGIALLFVWLWNFTGCSNSTPNRNPPSAAAPRDSAFATPGRLTAAVTNGNSVLLHWINPASVDGGVWIEYTTSDYDYVKLDAFPSDSGVASFVHPNVAPHTRFIYRLLPFFGRPTAPVEITTGMAPADNAPDRLTGLIDRAHAAPPRKQYSLRTLATFAKAMPADLTATLSSPTSVDLQWQDHASDEDGFLLELSAREDGDFAPCALLPPNTTSFRKAGLPPQTKCYFRVRAFFYGPAGGPVSAMVR